MKRIRVVLLDVDDTLTTNGKLTAEAFTAMEALYSAGLQVAPVTGRPAGWCDHIARMWPITGVVGENGAFYYSYNETLKKMIRVYSQTNKIRVKNQRRLDLLAKNILSEVPEAAISADQFSRKTDLAIDFCEDVPRLPYEQVRKIATIFEKAGATSKISSIHVNGWFGNYDKLSMSKRFLMEICGIDPGEQNQAITYIGDSPNDATMWAFFENSIGVANTLKFKDKIKTPPRYLTKNEFGAGFNEFAQALIKAYQP